MAQDGQLRGILFIVSGLLRIVSDGDGDGSKVWPDRPSLLHTISIDVR